MVALPRSFGAPLTIVNAEPCRTSAVIAAFPKAKLPEMVEDFGRSCAKMIDATFPARSRNATCDAAAMALGVSPDTIERILSGATKHPDPRVMFLCLGLYQTKTGKAWPIGGGFEIRITQTPAHTPTTGLARPCVNSPGAGATIRKNNNNGV
jgi:hypothetical protein